MIQDLIDSDSFGRVKLKHAFYEVYQRKLSLEFGSDKVVLKRLLDYFELAHEPLSHFALNRLNVL